jgi:hypothetical protein
MPNPGSGGYTVYNPCDEGVLVRSKRILHYTSKAAAKSAVQIILSRRLEHGYHKLPGV